MKKSWPPLRKYKNKGDKERGKLQKDVDKLQATYSAKVKARNEIETRLNRTKSLDELDERYETLKRANEEDQKVIDDENATSSDKQAAEARMEERREEFWKGWNHKSNKGKKLFLCASVSKTSSRNMAGLFKQLFCL